jgi:hypothetical protein
MKGSSLVSETARSLKATDLGPASLTDQFVELREWIESAALPALMAGPLKSDPSVKGIATEIVRLELDMQKARPIPIALVGLTGVGKSTLLNALLEKDFLPVGALGSQTAAFVTIRFSSAWEIRCEYIEESELREIYDSAALKTDEEKETGSSEQRDRAQRKVRAILGLKEDEALPPETEPPEEIATVIRAGHAIFSDEGDWQKQLTLHAKGRYWPITRSIEVAGPFDMLESGVVISDLPGAGDLNRARASAASAAIKDAGQILIACDGRFLQTSLMDQLESVGRLPHRLFTERETVEIVIVGTSLDAKVPDLDDDPEQVRDLGLDPANTTPQDIFKALCAEWETQVHSIFKGWLNSKANEFLPERSESERSEVVDRLMLFVKTLPTSAKDWSRRNRHKGGKAMKWCRTPAQTGIPELRRLINELADSQTKTTRDVLARRLHVLQNSVLGAIELSETALGANIEAILVALRNSKADMKEAQDHQVQIVDDLRLTVLERFQQIREILMSRIESASSKMRDMGRRQVQEHLEDLHWASLRATVRSSGLWITNSGRQVNLRDAMGGEITRLVPQAWSQVAEKKIGMQIKAVTEKVRVEIDRFATQIREIVGHKLADSVSRATVDQLFESSRETAAGTIDRSSRQVESLLGQTSKNMQQQVDEAVSSSLDGVCNDCSRDYGYGWKMRSVHRIIDGTSQVADLADERCKEIAESALTELEGSVVELCNTAVAQITKIGEDVPRVLSDAIERAQLITPQEQKLALGEARNSMPRGETPH